MMHGLRSFQSHSKRTMPWRLRPFPTEQNLRRYVEDEEAIMGVLADPNSATSSMSRGFHQGVFSFSDGFEQQQNRIEEQQYHHPAASGNNMLSEMFDFPAASSEFLPNQMSAAARPEQYPQAFPTVMGGGQGLSLSLSSSLQQPFQMAKAEEMRMRDDLLYFNQPPPPPVAAAAAAPYGAGGMGLVSMLRSSRYVRAAQELLEEFCSVGRGELKRGCRQRCSSSNPNPNSSSNPNPNSLSPSERFEHQRKKAKLISMLDEVDRRYGHYCSQMQMVVSSFDSVMGFGAATPYTDMAKRAMSRHFRCLKDAIGAQLKQSCELLGDKEGAGGSGITKGETPRLRVLDQNLRQQRAFQQMGMMEQEAWRPQRGLPERSVTILRAWLFEHFLHPYPSDADKHLLARQTGLSRNQVSNWFINARVRLWKPMVEDMYQQESKEDGEEVGANTEETSHQMMQFPMQQQQQQGQISSEIDAPAQTHGRSAGVHHTNSIVPSELCRNDGTDGSDDYMNLAGTGDVSLTLGLRRAGNALESGQFTIRDFGDC